MTKIEIPLSRSKILLLISSGIVMLAISIWFITSPSTFINSRRAITRYPIILILAGSILGTAMTIALISRTYQLFDKNHNLIIDELGIYNNVSFATSTFIKWDIIKSINVKKIRLTKFLKIYSNTPIQITNKGNWTNIFIKAKQKNQYVATLTADTLKIKFEDLEKLVRDGWAESKKLNGETLPTTLPNITPITGGI